MLRQERAELRARRLPVARTQDAEAGIAERVDEAGRIGLVHRSLRGSRQRNEASKRRCKRGGERNAERERHLNTSPGVIVSGTHRRAVAPRR